MNRHKTPQQLKTGVRLQSREHLSPQGTPLDLPDEEKSKNVMSFSELAVSQSLPDQQIASTAEINGPGTDNVISLIDAEQMRRQNSNSRATAEMVYISKVSHLETDPGLQSGPHETITEENSPPLSDIKLKNSKDLESQRKSSSKATSATLKERKTNEQQTDDGSGKKTKKEEKKSSFGSRILKRINKYRDRTPNKENKENKETKEKKRPFDRAKSIADIALEAIEMNEKEHEQIHQVGRTSFNPRTNQQVNLAASQLPDIAQEENPISQGFVKVALDQSMRPARGQGFKSQSAEEVALRAANPHHQHHAKTMDPANLHTPEMEVIEFKDPFAKAKTQSYGETPESFKALAERIVHSKRGVSSVTDLLEPRQRTFCEKLFQFVSLSFLYMVVFYGLMPLGLFFLANDYGYSDVKIYLNFAVLGALQALTEIILIHTIVDIPISKRIEEIEGENAGMINPKKYHIINKYTFTAVMAWVIGLQISAGVVIRSLGYDVDSTAILVTMICVSTIGAFLWFFIMLLQSPPTFENKKKLLNQELTQIGEIRKNFMEDLHQTRITLENYPKGPEKLRTAELIPLMPLAHAGAVANVKSNLKVDVRKFRSTLADHSPELIKMRLRVIRIYGMMIFFEGQMLALFSLLGVINDHNTVGVALVLLILSIAIGTCFGYVEFFTKTRQYLVSNMKVVSMLVNAAVYRGFFFVVDDKGSMIGAVLFKFAYKILCYYVYFFHWKKVDGCWRGSVGKLYLNNQIPKIHFYNSEEEKEMGEIKHQRKILQKFIIIQNVDLYFGLGTIFPLACSRSWFPDLHFNFNIALSSFQFYLGLLLIEVTADIIMSIHFCLMAKKHLQRKVRIVKISILNEIKSIVVGRESVLIILEALVMYLLLFIFMNEV